MEMSGGQGAWVTVFHLSEKMHYVTKLGFKGIVFVMVLGRFFMLCVGSS